MSPRDQAEGLGRVVIVGAGFVGSALALRLRAADVDVAVTTRSSERVASLRGLGLDAAALDLSDRASAGAILQGADRVVLCVAPGRGGDYEEVYGGGSATVVECLGSAHLVYTSSTGVYAANDGSWVDEDSTLVPREGRGAALRAAEDNVLDCGGRVLRLSGLIGRDRGPHRRAEALAGTERADGEAWLNLAPLTTVLDALEAALRRPDRGVVNVSAVAPMRRRDFYDGVLQRAGVDPIRWSESAADAPRGRRVRVDRLRSTLGVDPHPLDLELLFGD